MFWLPHKRETSPANTSQHVTCWLPLCTSQLYCHSTYTNLQAACNQWTHDANLKRLQCIMQWTEATIITLGIAL
jgi:hypothetical protein